MVPGIAIRQLPAMAQPVREPRLYIIVRRDLPRSVQAVQAAHVAVAYTLYFHPRLASWGSDGPTISMLGVEDQPALEAWSLKLRPSIMFHEPDLGNAPTAIAFYGTTVHGLDTLRLL